MHLSTGLTIAALAAGALAKPIEERYGSAGTFVDLILNAYPGSTAEVVNYPAAGGDSYGSSVQQGTQNVANQINTFNTQCPNTKLVVVGYSQGSQIEDNALCGGGDPNQGITNTNSFISSSANNAIKAVIWAGNPRNAPGQPYHYGSCTAGGFDPRPNGFTCPAYQSRIRSYCDASDPYCCNGNNAATHQGYGSEYGENALAFVKSKLG
ncbi:carbohydrate esterase [Knufia fluminis]|uniref:Carbohydrate esterase n=1 Tax=Knufia fluminis TaxID=191047 RepID=A0AAN8E7P1_9EURO|nr:carbohydrate esterase [Knufia fluminis]